ncbi:sulfur globule protein precursor [Bosea sp. 685]|uniref:sulfur globule protein precursor n=1 Tax=Bosea sp. 685 TaxID=3080057 RepID=UPI00289320D1|nr:sulfur globule protein precursor [Bosea sp. 685]WNJ92399.1 sulfur globule protein precursor [Bosea sp. 685]
MTTRTTVAGLATAFVLGAGALIGGSLATSSAAQAAPGWHGGYGHHSHFGHFGGGHGRWGHRGGWGRPIYAGGYYGGCYTVLRTRFVPGLGYVERPVTRCR